MSSPLEPDVTLSLTLPTSVEGLKPEERGIRLIQLLLTCANHASSGNIHHADLCLRQISQLSSINGDPVQRLSAQFASALAVRLAKRWPGIYKALIRSRLSNDQRLVQARSIFSEAFPYLGLSYGIIIRTLLRTMSEERVIHIVDLGCTDSKLWTSIIQSFGLMRHGPPHLMITCVNCDTQVLELLGSRLAKEAQSLAMPFQFNPVNVSLRDLTIDMLKVRPRDEEALAIISILNLHVLLADDDGVDAHFGANKSNMVKDCKQLDQFLAMVRSVSPKVMLLVEQEADHNMSRLGDRFIEGLHYYSALFDSFENTFGRSNSSSEERLVLEEMFGRQIENIVACEGLEREERHERYSRWMVRLDRGGFKPMKLWCDVFVEDVKGVLGANGKCGFKVINEKANLMICWHDRPLYCVSAWIC